MYPWRQGQGAESEYLISQANSAQSAIAQRCEETQLN